MKQDLFSLGDIFVSDFLEDDQHPRCSSELKMQIDTNTGLVSLTKAVDKSMMYGKYWYRSGINQSMRDDLLDVVTSINKVKKLQPGDVWLDIACNDGTLLEHVGNELPGVKRVGIDPADDSYTRESREHADEIVQDFFTEKAYMSTSLSSVKPKVVTTIAMFYDLDSPAEFIQDVRKIIDDEGLWVVQMSYTPLMLKQLAFDNICHEHIFYYSLFNIKALFEQNGFRVVDCQLNNVNGGSFRVFAIPLDAKVESFATQPYRDVADFRVSSLLLSEKHMNIAKPETWMEFYSKIDDLKEKTVSFIKEAKASGKTVWGYGASTKGNTLLQYFGLDNSLIDGIAERSPYKYGLRTVGTNIPIFPESEMRKVNPDYMLVLPWHFISEFVEREKEYLEGGGKFIVPCPKFQIIGKK